MLGISCSRWLLQFSSVWQVEYAYTTTCLVFHVHDASIRLCLTSGVCLHDNMLGISCSRCFNSPLFDKWSMPTRHHAWYFMFTMLQFASVWQVEYAYTTSCLVFHVHNASIRFCLTSVVCLHDIMLGISCSRCFNSLLFDKWSMPTRQHAWYFMFTMLQFASVWQVQYAYTTSCLVFHVHNASIRFCLTSGVCLHDIMLGISCSQCFNSLLFDNAYSTTWLVCHVHDASIRFCLTSGVCLHDIMLGISCSQCFNSLLFNKWSMPTRQHAWYFMFTMLQMTSGVCLQFHAMLLFV